MKNWVLNICSVLLVGVYMISSMGYGVHECTAKGTRNVILLFGETPCEAVHPGHHSNDVTYSHSDYSGCCAHKTQSHDGGEDALHNSNCCSTTTYTLSHKQLNQREITVEPIAFNIMPFMAYVVDTESYPVVHEHDMITEYPTGFKNIPICSLQMVSTSQIRI